MTVAFRQDKLGVSAVLELSIAWGADTVGDPTGAGWTWTDETANVYFASKIAITAGGADESSIATPGQINFTLLNTSHAYTPYDPSAGNFPNVKRNTPIRVRVNLGAGAVLIAQTFAIGFTPKWDASGKLALVDVKSAGILRRLGQGKTPLRSALYRASLNVAGTPAYYWSFEDGAASTAAASALAGGPSITATSGVFNFAKSAGPGGSDNLIQPDNGLHSAGAAISVAATTGWTVAFAFKTSTNSPGAYQRLAVKLLINDPLYSAWSISVQDGTRGIVLNGTFRDGTSDSPILLSTTSNIVDGNWHYALVRSSISGGNVTYTSFVDGVQQDTLTRATSGNGPITRVLIGDQDDFNMVASNVTGWAFGHLAIWQSVTVTQATLASAATGWLGELASTRMARLCAENNIVLAQLGVAVMPMGPQPIDTLLAALTECVKADGGFMYDAAGPGLSVTWLSNRYNLAAAITADVPSGHLSPPFAPTDDDQLTRNDYTANRTNGSSVRVIDTTSPLGVQAVGTYDSSIDVNTSTDAPLANIASWAVHMGTVGGLRYPSLPFDFATTAYALAPSFLAATHLGFRIDVTNVRTSAPAAPPDTVSVVVAGYSMTIDPFSWPVTFNCTPFAPWQVVQLDNSTYGRLASGTSTVQTLINTSAVSLSIASTGALWSTTDTPYDLNLDGERVTCTAMSAGPSPQTATITRSVNGVVASHAAGRPVELWNPLAVAL